MINKTIVGSTKLNVVIVHNFIIGHTKRTFIEFEQKSNRNTNDQHFRTLRD